MHPETYDRMLSAKAVVDRTSLSRMTIWRLTRKGTFPQPVRLSANRVAWSARAIEAWLQDRANDNQPRGDQAAA